MPRYDPPMKKLCVPRKRHVCRVCGTWIQKGEPCERWSGVEQGEGWQTCHAHPECLDKAHRTWHPDDWEERGEDERPTEKRKCTTCGAESNQWISYWMSCCRREDRFSYNFCTAECWQKFKDKCQSLTDTRSS